MAIKDLCKFGKKKLILYSRDKTQNTMKNCKKKKIAYKIAQEKCKKVI